MQLLSMQLAGLLQANLDTNQDTKLSGFYIRIVVEVAEAVYKINPEEFKDVFHTITNFHVGLIPIQIADGEGLASTRGLRCQ